MTNIHENQIRKHLFCIIKLEKKKFSQTVIHLNLKKDAYLLKQAYFTIQQTGYKRIEYLNVSRLKIYTSPKQLTAANHWQSLLVNIFVKGGSLGGKLSSSYFRQGVKAWTTSVLSTSTTCNMTRSFKRNSGKYSLVAKNWDFEEHQESCKMHNVILRLWHHKFLVSKEIGKVLTKSKLSHLNYLH